MRGNNSSSNFGGMLQTARDSKGLQSYVSERLQSQLKIFETFFAKDTLKFIETPDAEKRFATLKREITFELSTICKAKIWKVMAGDVGQFGNIKTNSCVHNQREVVTAVWEQIKKWVHILIVRQVDNYIEANHSETKKLVRKWADLHDNFKSFVERLLPFLGYISANYPQVVKEVAPGMTIVDHYEIFLIFLIKEKLKLKFTSFLEEFVFGCFREDISIEDIVRTESPLTIIHKYQIPIYDDAEVSFKDMYLEAIVKFVQNEVKIGIDLNYLELLLAYLKKNALITGSISIGLLESSNRTILENTILVRATSFRLLRAYKDSIPLEFGIDKSERFTQICNFVENLMLTYATRGRFIEFQELYLDLIRTTLSPIDGRKLDLAKSFEESCKFILIIPRNEKFRSWVRGQITENMGGSLALLDSYLKLCDFSIKNSNKNVMSSKRPKVNLDLRNSLVLHVPVVLRLDSMFLKQYCQSLFRRAIFFGPHIYETLTDEKFLEFHLLSVFSECYSKSSSYQALLSLKCEILKSSKLALDFEKEMEFAPQVNVFLFNRNHVPNDFKDENFGNITLPEPLKDNWDRFQQFYEKVDRKAEYKMMNLVYHLQFCEVETPYVLKSGRKLLLDLTLIQTSVLSLFNDADSLDYATIAHRSQLDDPPLKEALSSFTEIGLIKLEGDQYSFNSSFSPDERRMKNGKLRVLRNKTPNKVVNPNEKTLIGSQHKEGYRGHWTQEILKACIVRSVKGKEHGVDYNTLFEEVRSQVRGISVGEFKEALKNTLNDKFITQEKNLYIY